MFHITYKSSHVFKLDIIYSIIYFPDTVGQVYIWFTNLPPSRFWNLHTDSQRWRKFWATEIVVLQVVSEHGMFIVLQ